jgi:hypothetical protein
MPQNVYYELDFMIQETVRGTSFFLFVTTTHNYSLSTTITHVLLKFTALEEVAPTLSAGLSGTFPIRGNSKPMSRSVSLSLPW